MLTKKQKTDIAKRRLETMRLDLLWLMNSEPMIMKSLGLTAKYGTFAPGGSMTSDHTARLALESVKLSEENMLRLKWIDVVLEVNSSLLKNVRHSGKKKNPQEIYDDRIRSQILMMRVFNGYSFERCAIELKQHGAEITRQGVAYHWPSIIKFITYVAECFDIFAYEKPLDRQT